MADFDGMSPRPVVTPDIQEYVLCIAKSLDKAFEQVVLIRKNRPQWQRGKLNFPGGSVEPGEEPQDAAIRELEEETGIETLVTTKIGLVLPRNELAGWMVHVFLCEYDDSKYLYPETMTDEEVYQVPLTSVISMKCVSRNVPLMCGFVSAGIKGWVINDGPCQNEYTILFT